MAIRPTTDAEPGARDDTTATLAEKPSGGRVTQPATGSLATLDIQLPPRFEIRRIIGRGGMGVVVEVLDSALGRTVAVKLLTSEKRDPVHRARFRREAKAAAMLRHPNIVTVHDVDADRDFIVMELVHGESLRSRLRRDRVLAPAEVRRIGLALLDGLAAAHAAGIIHRDVKPANILIDEHGVVKLVDFGIASFGDRDLTSSGVLIGTPAYMAPEQLRGRVADVRSDLYAVGATLFEMTTGVQLHAADGSENEVAAVVLETTGDPRLARAIERAVAALPEHRFATARAFTEALVDATPDTSANPASAAPERSGPDAHASTSVTGARRGRMVLAVIATLAAAAIAVWVVAKLREPSRDLATSVAAEARGPLDATDARTVAVLPFIDHTREPRLDFAASGLPHIVATELRTIPELRVFGYYELLDRVADPASPAADWLVAARALGADVVVRGELFAEPAGVRLVVALESINGVIARFERMIAVDAVPAATRSVAGDIARAAVGRSTAQTEARTFDVERDLQLGISALERQDFTAADDHLTKVELQAPDLAEAHYHRAVLNWWLSRDVTGPVTRALAGTLTPAQRGFMEGLRLVIDQNDERPAIARFRELSTQFPNSRDIQYGLFEALFHGGHAAEAMVVYRRLGERHPRFRLGLKHALAYYIGHADEDGMAWAVARLAPNGHEPTLWQARALVARRDYRAAVALLRRHDTGDAASRLDVQRELAQIYVLDRQLGLAVDLATSLKQDASHAAPDLLGLARARGNSDDIEEWSSKAASAADLQTGSETREHGWPELAAVQLPGAHTTHLRRIAKQLHRDAPQNIAVAHVLVAGALGERTRVDDARSSAFHEVVAIADAYHAEWAKDWKRAAASWERAIQHAADGSFVIVEKLGSARASRMSNDHAAVLAACDAVIHPRRFSWAWGGAIGPCLRWSAEAATKLGRPAEARGHWEHLLELRSAAPKNDELVGAAQVALARKP